MRRGKAWWVNFEPSVGDEIRKQRPAVIVSNDAANRHLNRVQVVPLTASVGKLYPGEALVEFNGRLGKALAGQLTTASKERLISQAGRITTEEMGRVERAIRSQLVLTEPA